MGTLGEEYSKRAFQTQNDHGNMCASCDRSCKRAFLLRVVCLKKKKEKNPAEPCEFISKRNNQIMILGWR